MTEGVIISSEEVVETAKPPERIRFITHNGKRILLVDLSNCSTDAVEKMAHEVPEIVTAQPLESVLILCDFTGAEFGKEALRAMQKAAVFDKAYIKRSAWVGAERFPEVFYENLKSFSRREFPTFKTRQEALAWLVEGE